MSAHLRSGWRGVVAAKTALGQKLWRYLKVTVPLADVASGRLERAVLDAVQVGSKKTWANPNPQAGLGVHWTDSEGTARYFEGSPEAYAHTQWSEGRGPAVVDLPVLLQGRVGLGHVRSDPEVIPEYGMVQFDLRYDLPITESEVPVAKGAPVLVEAVEVWLPSRDWLDRMAAKIEETGYGGTQSIGAWTRFPVNMTMAASKTAASFSPSLVASWGMTKPWNASRADLEAQRVPSIVLGRKRGSETASYRDGVITVTEEWLSFPEDARRAVLYHEAGHGLESSFSMAEKARYFGVDNALDIIDLPGAQRFGYNPDEVIADAYAVAWTEPSWASFEGGAFILDTVRRMAREKGYPLP